MKRLLLVGGDDAAAGALRTLLPRGDYSVVADATPAAALLRTRAGSIDCVICDINVLGASGVEYVRRHAAIHGSAPVIVIGPGRLEGATLAAIRAGASDHLVTPLQPDELRLALQHLDERERLRHEVTELRVTAQNAAAGGGLVVESPVMRKLTTDAVRVAAGTAPVLLIGEPGAGKESLARFIHQSSPRVGARFIVVDLAAVPLPRIGPVLFGEGTGPLASAGQGGIVADADGGTLLLEGIDRLPVPSQALLLRALAVAGASAVDGAPGARLDVRLIATAPGPLDDRVLAGEFRGELFDRLRADPLVVPSLRDRREDIPSLAAHVLAQASGRVGRPFSLSPRALALLVGYNWPGNVTELRGVLERAVVLAVGNTIDAADLALGDVRSGATGAAEALKAQVGSAERMAIARALANAAGNRRAAAHALGISLRTLFYKLRRHGLD